MLKLSYLMIVLISATAWSQESEKSPWTHESEASVVQVSGNTRSESYSAKQKTSYTFDKNVITANARYVQTKIVTTETGRAWDASLRYERVLSDMWSAFVQQGAESDKYAGYVQRDNSDIGGKYYFIKSDKENFFSEAGYRYTTTILTTADAKGDKKINESKGRLYLEWSKQLNETVSAKLWVEYLHNFDTESAYLVNYEPSLSVMLNKTFSLKISNLVKYQNEPETGKKKEDRTFTTSIVAKF